MRVSDVSGIVRTAGSDYDVNVWLSNRAWKAVTKLLSAVGVGAWRRPETYRVGIGPVEVFFVNEANPDTTTLAVESNIAAQRAWDYVTLCKYTHAKRSIAHLTGTQRKQEKARLAGMFDLNPCVYAVS